MSCVRTGSSYVLQLLIREERKSGMPSRPVRGPYSCKSIFLPGNWVSGLLPCTRIPGPFIRNLSWHIRCLITLTPHTHTHTHTHTRTPSSEENASFSLHEIAWQFCRSIQITIFGPVLLIRKSHAGVETLALQSIITGKGHAESNRNFMALHKKLIYVSPICARPKNVLNWCRFKCLQEVVKLR